MILPMVWELRIDQMVFRWLRKIPAKDARRIFFVMTQMAANPYAGDIEKIRGQNDVWRRRVGTWRIFFEVHAAQRVVHVFHVERRSSHTY